MSIKGRGEVIKQFIIDNVSSHPVDIVKLATEHFECSRQAVNKHMLSLVQSGVLNQAGNTRNKTYSLRILDSWIKEYKLSDVAEDAVWRMDVSPSLVGLSTEALDIWHYGFTEMFNNAIDHSDGNSIAVEFIRNAASTQINIMDNGIGIFKKIQAAMGLMDERHSVLELAKGKFTTDPRRHSGEGIFFSSRMFDNYSILSGDVYFSHKFKHEEDWIIKVKGDIHGTCVTMELNNKSDRVMQSVFDEFAGEDDYGFNKTTVPVSLTTYGDDNLISRSQAKRLLARFDRFKMVILDFSGVNTIGQAFADEIFRVFRLEHPEVDLVPIRANKDVTNMITRAEAAMKGN